MTARYTVLAIPGTSESHVGDDRMDPVGMLSFVTRELDSDIFECLNTGYPSSFGFPMSEDESMQICLKSLEEMVRATPLPVILLGYSQGAQVARKLLGLLAAGDPSVADLEVVGAGFLADPYRNAGVNEGPMLTGYGLAGAGPAWPDDIPVWELAYPEDPITNSAPDSILRPVADVLKFFTARNPLYWASKVSQMILTGSDWQAGDHAPTPDRVIQALADINAYGIQGKHQAYSWCEFPGTNRTYCQHLADLIDDHFGGAA